MNHLSAPIALNQANLPSLPLVVRVPGYARQGMKQGIVHIGVGGFFRAHQAVYLDDLLHLPGNDEWSYCGIGLLTNDAKMRDALLPQDCLYTVVERGADGDNVRIVGALADFLLAPDDPEAAIEKMASPHCRIVSLTITEGGYYVNHGSGEFDNTHPDIVYELSRPAYPRCSFGYLVAALDRRRRRGFAPFTIMSCDNLQGNGDLTRKMLLAFTALLDPDLSAWLAEHGAFPNSMVDRITPATTDLHRKWLAENFSIEDIWPVMTEPFKQWVIEDHFPGGRPAWELVGAQMTTDVLPYEKMKLRLLNASHQAMCYIGMLLGYEFAHEAMADADIRELVRNLMDVEVTPLLAPVQGIDLEQYKETLLARFSNPTIRDQLARIGTEGSARVPKFVLPSIAEQLARGGAITLLSFTVASWFRYLAGHDDAGKPLPINDPLAERLQEYALRGGVDPSLLLSIRELFGDLSDSEAFSAELGRALQMLYHGGARQALQNTLSEAGHRRSSPI